MPKTKSMQPFIPQKIPKPWGYELIYTKTDDYMGKLLHIDKGHRLSLHYHEKKTETLYVIEGKCSLFLDDTWHLLDKGSYVHIEPGQIHRIKALSDCDIIEVSTPHPDDTVRIEDDYGRCE